MFAASTPRGSPGPPPAASWTRDRVRESTRRRGNRNSARSESFGLIRDAYDDVQVRPERFVDAGDDVVVVAKLTGTSRGARVPIEREQGYVWTIRDGKAIRFRWFNTAPEALEAVGLTE